MTAYRRFEMHFSEKGDEAIRALLDHLSRFAATPHAVRVSRGPAFPLQGFSANDSTTICVDVPDTPENRNFFVALKDRFKSRQLDCFSKEALRRERRRAFSLWG